MQRFPYRIFIAIWLIVLSSEALAQPPVQIESIQQRETEKATNTLRQLTGRIESAKMPITPTTGQGRDVFLLDKHKLFYVRYDGGFNYTDNAYSQPDERDDVYYLHEASFGLQTLIAQKYNISLEVNNDTARYAEFTDLDFDSLGWKLLLSRTFGKFTLGGQYGFTDYQNRGMGHSILKVNQVSGFASYFHQFNNKFGFATDFVSTNYFSDPSDNDMRSLLVSPSLHFAPNKLMRFIFGYQFSYNDYPDYYQNIFSKDRNDHRNSAFALLNINHPKWKSLNIRLGARYTDNDSTLSALDYDAVTLFANIGIMLRF